MAKMEIIDGPNIGQTHDLGPDETIIGRNPKCDLVVPSSNISRKHTRIVRRGDSYFVEDLGSLNGTYLNGRRINNDSVKLQHLDRINVYDVLLLFREDESGSSVMNETVRAFGVRDLSSRYAEPKIINTLDARSGPRLDVRAEEKLRAVLKLNRLLGSSLDVDTIMPKILDSLFDLFTQSERGYILIAEEDDRLQLRAQRDLNASAATDTMEPVNVSLAERVIDKGEAVLSSDKTQSPDDSVFEDTSISILCAPLVGAAEKPAGVMYLETRDMKDPYQQEDLELLVSVATIAGQAIEYANEHEANLRMHRRERDIAMARQVQLHFLPLEPPIVPGFEFFDFYSAAAEVGGDYYGYIPLPDGRVAIAVADVSGKGVSAALLMAKFCSDVRYCLATCRAAKTAVQQLNKILCESSDDNYFITLGLCLLDPSSNRVEVASAGHVPSFLRRGDSGEVIDMVEEVGGLPLGCIEDAEYGEASFEIQTGDVIVMYTDGISEAMDSDGQLYGLGKIRSLLQNTLGTPSQVGEALIEDVRSFSGGLQAADFAMEKGFSGENAQSDDCCVVCFGRS